jgi:6,7-dimethyl-8-ribityllumazine synthase
MLIGIVTARFNSEITLELERGAITALKKAGLSDRQIWSIRVPGAVEIPLAAKALFKQGCDAVVTLGAVIRGETAHFDYVCQSVERGVTQLILELGKPIGFGVLTTENEDQAYARTIGHHGNKGAEVATSTLEMLALMKKIRMGPPKKSKIKKKSAGKLSKPVAKKAK